LREGINSALADVKSAIQFHIDTFGAEVLNDYLPYWKRSSLRQLCPRGQF